MLHVTREILMKNSNVQVTLQILTSIIEKAPRDLSLYGGSILTVLDTVLGSKDINMVEESIPTFESYCKYVDAANLAADQSRKKQYESIVKQYAAFAAADTQITGSTAQNVPLATRRRTIALKAVRAVVGSDALGVNTADQLNIVMPVILDNLDLEKGGSLAPLQQKATTGEKQSLDLARKRRMSNATVPSIDEVSADPAMASETTADADKVAEEEVRVLAVRCLKQIFSISTGTSRVQMRLATSLVLRYIATKERPRPSTKAASTGSIAPDWATKLFETIARWTPVQDRFIIVITTVETLVRSPIVEAILEKQLMLASLVDWLLRSDINLIGLSVMDVLLRLIQHTLLLLQLGSRELGMSPQMTHGDTLGLYKDIAASFDPTSTLTTPERGRLKDTKETTVSPIRKELLTVLQRCISDLATHIYYTDQISDMLTAIMARLKPSPASDVPNATAAVNDPTAATKAIAESGNLQEDPSTDGFFSFATARIVALKAVKDILITANSRRSSGAAAEVRSRVGVQVWDGTQWLLKDDDLAVQLAYVDALVTWLRLETNKADMLLPQDGTRKPRSAKRDTQANGDISIAKRAVSNASRRGEKQIRSTFLQLLHLAIFDQAYEKANDEKTILLLFLLLWTLVERLGVNAIRTGLPMILNLQGAVLNGDNHSPGAKGSVASLVHGYLWAVAEKFDFEGSPAGNEINAEISRRKRFGCWCDRIKFPPSSIAHIASSQTSTENPSGMSEDAVSTIRPFLNISVFVDEIATAYDRSLVSPPSSPPASPGRVFSVPTLGFGYGYNAAPVHKPAPQDQIPQKVKDEMSGTWSREACIAAIDKESNPSLNGSRTAPSSTGRQHLAVNRQNGVAASGNNTPDPEPAHAFPLTSGLGSLSRARDLSTTSSLRDVETSSRDSTMRFSDLKRALAGTNGDVRNHSPLRRPATRSRRSTRSSGSESMVSWNVADDDSFIEASEGGENMISDPRPGTAISTDQAFPASQVGSTYHDQTTITSNARYDPDIPPVPKIPSQLNLPMAGTWPRESQDTSPVRQETLLPSDLPQRPTELPKNESLPASSSVHSLPRPSTAKRRPVSRAGGASVYSHSHSTTGRKTNLNDILASIKIDDVVDSQKAEERTAVGGHKMFRPPY